MKNTALCHYWRLGVFTIPSEREGLQGVIQEEGAEKDNH